MRARVSLLLITLLITLPACSSKSHRVRLSGFLPSSIALKPSSDDSNMLVYTRPGFRAGLLQVIHVEPVVTDRVDGLSSEQRESISSRMTDDIQDALRDAVHVAEAPAPDTPSLRVALTGLSRSSPLLNIHPATKITGLGLGGVALEAMLVDTTTHEILYAVALSRDAPKRVGSGLTKWDDAHSVVDQWARELAALWSASHHSP
ncbi:MAG: DUF3313 domain-containing protein [Phycisphaerales bacterium JB043]